MAYNEVLARRIRDLIPVEAGPEERKMFGGVAFLINGHMACGIAGQDLMVRVGRDAYAETLSRPHAREMTFTGRPMTGMVFVGPDGTRTAASLRKWVDHAVRFALSEPRKKKRS